jgi:hypothetical protein
VLIYVRAAVAIARGLVFSLVGDHDIVERIFNCCVVLDPRKRRGLTLIGIPHESRGFAVSSDETSPQPLGELCLELTSAAWVDDALSELPALDDADRR